MTKWSIQASWSDVPHIDPNAQAEMEASYMPHERDARVRGIPSLGAGAIYPVPESDFVCEPFEFPAWYKFFYAMDVGWQRTAVLWGAVDPEHDILYWHGEYYRGQAEPPIHAAAVKARGDWMPGVIDPASRIGSQKDGDALLTQYTQLGLHLVKADNAVEAGIYAVWTRKSTGRLKVFSTLHNYLAEHRIYRRDENGKRVKENDHLMDCERYGVMTGIALAAQRPPDQWMPMMTRKTKHEFSYDPMAAAWSPQSQQQGSALGQPQQSRSYMPHSPYLNR
jgi:hypothetical protein